jgi:hypothetical protein
MSEPFESSTLDNGQAITAAQFGHLPIVASYERRLGLVEIVNWLVPVEMDVEPSIIYIADSAMVTEENLERAGPFISRLPATYNEYFTPPDPERSNLSNGGEC